MWASSCWNRRTLVSPVRAPDSSLRWRTPKSASRNGNSRQDLGRWSNIRLKEKDNSIWNISRIKLLQKNSSWDILNVCSDKQNATNCAKQVSVQCADLLRRKFSRKFWAPFGKWIKRFFLRACIALLPGCLNYISIMPVTYTKNWHCVHAQVFGAYKFCRI